MYQYGFRVDVCISLPRPCSVGNGAVVLGLNRKPAIEVGSLSVYMLSGYNPGSLEGYGLLCFCWVLSQACGRTVPPIVRHFCRHVHLRSSTLALLLEHDPLHARHGHVAQGAV